MMEPEHRFFTVVRSRFQSKKTESQTDRPNKAKNYQRKFNNIYDVQIIYNINMTTLKIIYPRVGSLCIYKPRSSVIKGPAFS